MKIYIAAPWTHKHEAILAGARFTAAGHEITSNWFHHAGDPTDSAGVKSNLFSIVLQAREDIADVMRADCLVVLNLAKSEGKAVETGIALANQIPIISVGPRSNIFQTLGVEVPDLDAAILVLSHFIISKPTELLK